MENNDPFFELEKLLLKVKNGGEVQNGIWLGQSSFLTAVLFRVEGGSEKIRPTLCTLVDNNDNDGRPQT